jgi:DNA-binding response OmpR family regulator
MTGLKGTRVLVVDDEVIIAAAIEDALIRAGHNVAVAHDLEDALALADVLPDLQAAVVDLGLPDGSGLHLIRALRERWPGLPVVVSTGWPLGDDGDRAQPSLAPAVALPKPWTEAQLVAALKDAVAAGAPPV